MLNNLESQKLSLTADEAAQVSSAEDISTINAALFIIINEAGKRRRTVTVRSITESVRHDLQQRGFAVSEHNNKVIGPTVLISW